MSHYMGLREWCEFHKDGLLDDLHLDTFYMWTRYMAFPYLSAMTPALGDYFTNLQARLQDSSSISELGQLGPP
jgi:hypothetical protein